MNPHQTQAWLDGLRGEDNLRELRRTQVRGKYIAVEGRQLLNFSSNDYLGLTEEAAPEGLEPAGAALQREFFRELGDDPAFMMSNPSSRLMGGNDLEYTLLEDSLAALWPEERRALVLGSGYLVNTGAPAALTTRGDLILADKSIHASLLDGLRLCEAEWLRFRHNDMEHLESLVRKHRHRYDNVWVVTESVFSMDGDCCPLERIVELKNRYGLQIYLDEAHSFGVYGPAGAGYAAALGLSAEVDAIAAPLGKALASTGGFLITDALTRELLINRMRTLIFSTALPSLNLRWSRFLVERLPQFEARREHLQRLVRLLTGDPGATPIIPIVTGESAAALRMASMFRQEGFWVTAIRHPTVPRGRERVRVSLNASLTEAEIIRFKETWKHIEQEIKAGQ